MIISLDEANVDLLMNMLLDHIRAADAHNDFHRSIIKQLQEENAALRSAKAPDFREDYFDE